MQAITNKMAFSLPDFMASPERKKSDHQRPRPLQLSKSFIRPPPASPDRITRVQRASTIQNGVASETMGDKSSTAGDRRQRTQSDLFKKGTSEEEEDNGSSETTGKLPDDFDKLPIELVSLSDRFVVQHLGRWTY